MSQIAVSYIRGCESGICDFCKFYLDAGSCPEKRGGFAGYGQCSIDLTEVTADNGCNEHFVCRICQHDILKHWCCL